ncbi:metallophosphoesterase family protein [Rhodospirillum rubrum]|uniref:Metallophosphoesterase n=1 Tax=Rhodospirillum rubrum (strain ATCC 11170 / ATH 1.1.1 / DSM 467 / LMG 4362 / NCIMB 8255 / S1) TaxID=269796 RepID=Q2RUX3_RHORT|nr:DNA repair exonuclease [Rhodospirillum rubrum]ABC22072.1 Metallophosphoesterase [Rhodospirillum rubrum ATCC 11170]AEO47784.1 metallophosphoesterase [Rhodospirillum rubrum F11]MBK5953661.1 DNA repair exonuclease [Rhodospirillum rubrum]QXG81724.1 DNA repair exonuclease [Rhodospirillum rubrum]HAQ00007.1 DNA repair exonuclease [Rhodospirillum rubrum]
MRILHAADIHLDSPLSGLIARAGGQVGDLTTATRRAFTAMIDYALEAGVDLVLIAGDLYDGDWRDFSTGLFFLSQMARLERQGIRVAVVQGNHDAENRMTRSLRWPPTVKVFRSDRAETWIPEGLEVAIHGRSFPRRDVTEDLSAGYPPPVAGLFNIGLLHTAADGRLGHTPYAPCDVPTLVGKGYDYWALGHVHGRAILHERPWVVFPGNLQARHVNEPGAKGATLLTIDGGEVTALEALAFDVLRWVRLEVDLGGCASPQQAYGRIETALAEALTQAEGRALAVRLTLSGATAVHDLLAGDPERTTAECLALTERAGGEVWLEKVAVATTPPRQDGAPAADELFAVIARILETPEERAVLRADLEQALTRVPPTIRQAAGLTPLDEQALAGLLAAAEATLRRRLLDSPE